MAAVQLSAALLGVIFLLLMLEHASRRQMRFAAAGQRFRQIMPWRLSGSKAFWASLACALPLIFGFILPVIIMVHLAFTSEETLNARYWSWLTNTLTLSTVTAILAVVIAVWLAYTARIAKGGLQLFANRMVSLGCARCCTSCGHFDTSCTVGYCLAAFRLIFNSDLCLSHSFFIFRFANCGSWLEQNYS
jgi:iron(III) transport system permease protein